VAVASNDGVWLRYDERFDGEPLLMIMGLGGSGAMWWRLLPHLEGHCRAIVMDNRGTGESDRIRGPLRMADMVADALAVLDATGEESAHVIGVSMGGMVAQQLALDHRERVRSLILGCTTAGGRSGAPPWRLLAASALRPLLGARGTFSIVAPALYAASTREQRPQRVAEDLRLRAGDATPAETILAQLVAIAGHDVRARLPELAGLPVTVLHGSEDALVPPARGDALAAAIPGARLVRLPGCGHMLTTDAEEGAAAAVVEHLQRVSGGVAPPQQAAAGSC
jgi:3-oxoadipate enol-lactonase